MRAKRMRARLDAERLRHKAAIAKHRAKLLRLRMLRLRRIRAMRTGKPLYYDRHLRLVKISRNYIQPDDLVQVERNRTAS